MRSVRWLKDEDVCVYVGGGAGCRSQCVGGVGGIEGGGNTRAPSGYRKLGRSLWICLSLLSNTELVVTWHKERGRGREEGEGARGGVHVTNMESVCVGVGGNEGQVKVQSGALQTKGDRPQQAACSVNAVNSTSLKVLCRQRHILQEWESFTQ